MMESRSRSVLDTPLSRGMTIFARSYLSRAAQRAKAEATPFLSCRFTDRFAGGMKSRGDLMEPLCALNPPDLELLQRASHLSDEPGGTKN